MPQHRRSWLRAIVLVCLTGVLFASTAVAQRTTVIQPESAMSADGRFVAFSSAAATLVPGDTNGSWDIFVRDRQTDVTTRVSVTSAGVEVVGDSFTPSISADGRIVVFVSRAPLVPDDTNVCEQFPSGPSCGDIYLHDRATGQTTRLRVAPDGAQSNAESTSPQVNGDGRFVVFSSYASNLVPDDTNGEEDVFLLDRQTGTTTRVSVAADGTQAEGWSSSPTISDDGQVVAFISTAGALVDPRPIAARRGMFVRRLDSGLTTFASPEVEGDFMPVTPDAATARGRVTRDGSALVGVITWAHKIWLGPGSYATDSTAIAYRYDLRTGGTWEFSPRYHYSEHGRIVSFATDASGTVVAFSGTTPDAIHIRGVTLPEEENLASEGNGLSLSADGLLLVRVSPPGIVEHSRDADRDGMSDGWEWFFGFNPSVPEGGLDADGDGITNADEYRAITHPKGDVRRYFAEGVRNAFFSTQIHMHNPSASFTTVVVSCERDDGVRLPFVFTLAPHGRATLGLPAQGSSSTLVESEHAIALTRTIAWGPGAYGLTAETAVEQPRTTWYFAEGATHGTFDLFYLLFNPTDVDAEVTVTYLRPAPLPPVILTYTVGAHQRRTIWVDQEPGLDATDVAARIDADRPIVAERSMYYSTRDVSFAAGTSAAGIPAPAARWYVAEGATGDFFDLFLLIGNPGETEAEVAVSYLLPDGAVVDKRYRVAAASRLTIGVDGEDARLANTSLSATVTSLNGVDILVERAMWWPSGHWYGGHVTAATTETSHRWALAGAWEDGGPPTPPTHPFATYLLVANPSGEDATVTFSLTGTDSARYGMTVRCVKTVVVKGNSRFTSGLLDLCDLPAARSVALAGTIESTGAGVVVEQSTYFSSPTEFWTAGASTLLTRLP